MLILHITIALLSIIVTAAGIFKPSSRVMNASLSLVAATLASGTILVVASRSPLMQACISGLTYLSVEIAGLAVVRYRLTKVRD